MAIRLLVDSASDIEQAEAERDGISIIPMQILFGEEEFLDGVNLSHAEFFEKLIETDVIPKTSQINEFRFGEAFEKLTEGGDEVLCITMSSKLSGKFGCAQRAAKKYDGRVQVVDSLNVTVGERILVEYAVRLIKSGTPLNETVALLNEKKKRVRLIALLNTLLYLQKGGRISKLTAFAGGLLNVKPVIVIKDGEVKIAGKALGSKKGNNMLVQLIRESGVDFSMPFATAYSGLSDTLLQKYLCDSAELWKGNATEIPSYMIGSTIGTHAGPGAIAVAFFGAEKS